MAFRIRKAMGALAIAVLGGATLLGVGCGGSDDNGSERAVEWALAPPVGPNWIRVGAQIEGCDRDPPLLEEPIIEYEDDRVYIELRRTPEDDKNLCFLNLVRGFKKITFERDLDELVIFDASTDPPEQRWLTESPLPIEDVGSISNSAMLRKMAGASALLPGVRQPSSAKIETVKWQVIEPPREGRMLIGSVVDYCSGEPKPKIERVDVESNERHVVLTPFRQRSASVGRSWPCAGLELRLKKGVVIPRRVSGSALYDGSTHPPSKRWPLPQAGAVQETGVLKAVEWGVSRVWRHAIEINGLVPHCDGTRPKPYVAKVGRSYRRKHGVVVTMLVKFPSRRESGGCAHLLIGVAKRVRFERQVDELVLYDGKWSPPERRLTRGQR